MHRFSKTIILASLVLLVIFLLMNAGMATSSTDENTLQLSISTNFGLEKVWYLGADMSSNSSSNYGQPFSTSWIEHFYLDNIEEMMQAYPDDQAQWTVTRIQGTAEISMTQDLSMDLDPQLGIMSDITLSMETMPLAPENAQWKVACDYGPAHWEDIYTILFKNSPTGMPAGIEKSFGDTLYATTRERLGLGEKVVFKDNWSIPGEEISFSVGGSYNPETGTYWQNGITHDENWIWDVANNPGVYSCRVTKQCANIQCTEGFTLIVMPADWFNSLTDGTPTGSVAHVNYSTSNELTTGTVEIEDFYRQSLNNDYTRFTFIFTAPADYYSSLFEGNGDLFFLDSPYTTYGKRQIITFDLQNDHLELIASEFTLIFYKNDDDCFAISTEQAPTTMTTISYNITDGNPVGEPKEVNYNTWHDDPDELPGEIHSITSQSLDNGYTRYSVQYTVPEMLNISVFNPPNGDKFMYCDFNIFTSSEKSTLVFDIANENLTEISISIKFFGSNRAFGVNFLPANSIIIGGGFRFTDSWSLNGTPNYYVCPGMLTSNWINYDSNVDDGKPYGFFILLTYRIENFNLIKDQFSTLPEYEVKLKSGNLRWVNAGPADGSYMDVYLLEIPDPQTAEFELNCTVEGNTYSKTVRINFVELDSVPTGVEIGWPDPMIVKAGMNVDENVPAWFADNWSIERENTSSKYDGPAAMWDAMDWSSGVARWTNSGVFPMQLVAISGSVRMNRTITLYVTEADGTFPASKYISNGQVIKLPDDTTRIESEAFAGAYQVREVDIPESVIFIAEDAFDDTDLFAIYAHNQYVTDWAVSHGVLALVE